MSTTESAVLPRAAAGPDLFGLGLTARGVGVVEINRAARSITSDVGFLTMLGVSSEHRDAHGWQLLRRVHPADRPRLCATVATLTGPRRERFRTDVGLDHTYRWLEARFDLDPLDDTLVVAVVIDVHDLVIENLRLDAARAELAASDHFHRSILAVTPDVIHIYDVATGAITRAVDSGLPLPDFCSEAVAVLGGTGVERFVPYPDRVQLDDALRLAADLTDQRVTFVRHRVVTESGEIHWLRRRIGVLARDDAGRATSLFIASLQVTDLVSVEHQLEHAATHDESTGLANRRKFLADLDAGLRHDEHVAIAVLEIDGLRSVGDSRGRDLYEALLSAVARRLRSSVRADDVIARLGDVEFGVIVASNRWAAPDAIDPVGESVTPHIGRVVDRIEELLAEPFHVGDVQVQLAASIGICAESPDGSGDTMVRAAHAAMDKARRVGPGSRYTFDDALAEEIRSQEMIERNLRRALRDDALEVHYQPIVVPRTGRVCSVEALMRLRDESGQLLPVEEVIAVAEHCGLVSQLDDQMLVKASRQVASWRCNPRYHDLTLAVNRSAKDLNRAGFHHRIMRALAETGLPGEALIIEVTETVLLHVGSARLDEMMRLRESHVRFAIDDFGTGYASLSQLISLPISEIKVDRSFTARMLDDSTCAALVDAAVRIASDLGLACVIEGVETVDQLAALPAYDGLLVQGYLYGRPRPATGNGPVLDTAVRA